MYVCMFVEKHVY